MLKKLIIGISGFMFICSFTLFAYRSMEPKAATDNGSSYLNAASPAVYSVDSQTDQATPDTEMENQPKVASEAPSLKNDRFSEGTHYVFFCRADNPDCTYINDYVFKPLTEELKVSSLDSIEYYDLAPLGDNYPAAKLKNQWGFDRYPAFVSLTVNADGSQFINNTLIWNKEDPIDSEDLKRWMIDNQIWTGIIEDQGELIEQPE